MPKRRDRGIRHLAFLELGLFSLRRAVTLVGRAIAGESPHISQTSDLVVLEGIGGPAEGVGDARLAAR
jgi:hypothetical protein